MSRRSVGLAFLNVAGALVIVGALYDLLVPSVPPNHRTYLGAADGLDPVRRVGPGDAPLDRRLPTGHRRDHAGAD